MSGPPPSPASRNKERCKLIGRYSWAHLVPGAGGFFLSGRVFGDVDSAAVFVAAGCVGRLWRSRTSATI
jgi:hypothetical protein